MRTVTPLHLQIAIHYHISTEQWPQLSVPIHRKYADDLTDAGLLRPRSGLATGGYEKTDGLEVWIEAVCSTPFPVKRWVMPKDETDLSAWPANLPRSVFTQAEGER